MTDLPTEYLEAVVSTLRDHGIRVEPGLTGSHSRFWLPAWGPRPENLETACTRAREAVRTAPLLIPLYAHRYLPAAPYSAGNPGIWLDRGELHETGRRRGTLEEEFADDQDYYFSAATIDALEEEGAGAELVALLRRALGDRLDSRRPPQDS